jgi:hypothetical protein
MQADESFHVETNRFTQSLNVSVAAAVVFHQLSLALPRPTEVCTGPHHLALPLCVPVSPSFPSYIFGLKWAVVHHCQSIGQLPFIRTLMGRCCDLAHLTLQGGTACFLG